VALKADKAAPARDILKKFEISIHDPVNGAWLPANTKSPNVNGATVHSTLHTTKYYDYVNASLEGAQSRDQAGQILMKIRTELEDGTYGP
jgi:hypothetical protein